MYTNISIENYECKSKIITAAKEGADLYLKYDTEEPIEYKDWRYGYSKFVYNKGFHRALCLINILGDSENTDEFKLLSIYMILTEKNGTRLKRRLNDSIQKLNWANNALIRIENYVCTMYSINPKILERIQSYFLQKLHDKENWLPIMTHHDSYEGGNNNEWKQELYNKVESIIHNERKKLFNSSLPWNKAKTEMATAEELVNEL